MKNLFDLNRKMYPRYLLGLFALITCTSCLSKPSVLPVIDVDHPSGSVDLKLSDLMEHITIVPLETQDNLLLSTAGTSFTITNNYILAATQEKLLQFDRQGNYIRTLAYKGNGPNEFNSVMNLLVDEQRELIYYSQFSTKESVSSIDLKTGGFPTFFKPNFPAFSIQAIDSDGSIYGFPSPTAINIDEPAKKMEDSVILAFRYNPHLENSVTTFKGSHNFFSNQLFQTLFRQGNHLYYHFPSYSDTLFQIYQKQMIPQYVIVIKNQLTDFFKGGSFLRFLFSATEGTVVIKRETQIFEGNGLTVITRALDYLLINKKTDLQRIKSMTIDPVAFTIQMDNYMFLMNEHRDDEVIIDPIPLASGVWGYYAVEAYNMMKLIDHALKSNRLSTGERKALEVLSSQIDDESNPVLIIGKIK